MAEIASPPPGQSGAQTPPSVESLGHGGENPVMAHEADGASLARTLLLMREDLTATATALAAAQASLEEARAQLAQRTEEINEWRAYHEAVQNDLEQANALASDFRAQLSSKTNEMAQMRGELEHKTRAVGERDAQIVELRGEAGRRQSALEEARLALQHVGEAHQEARRQWDMERFRLEAQLESARSDAREQQRKGGRATHGAGTDEAALRESLDLLEQSIVRIRRRLTPGKMPRPIPSAPSPRETEHIEISFSG